MEAFICQITVENVSALSSETLSSTLNNLIYILIGATLTFLTQFIIEKIRNKNEKKAKKILSIGNLTEYQTLLLETTVDLAQKYYKIQFYLKILDDLRKANETDLSDIESRFIETRSDFNNLKSRRSELIAKTERELMLYRLYGKHFEKAKTEIKKVKAFDIIETVNNVVTEKELPNELNKINENLSVVEKESRKIISPLVESFVNSLID